MLHGVSVLVWLHRLSNNTPGSTAATGSDSPRSIHSQNRRWAQPDGRSSAKGTQISLMRKTSTPDAPSDTKELVELCDRVLVLRESRIVTAHGF